MEASPTDPDQTEDLYALTSPVKSNWLFERI